MSLPPKTGIVPPPPPPPPAAMKFPTSMAPQPPLVASPGPSGTFQVELLIYNGSPFKDHWAYWVRSRTNPDIGVKIHATGNVGNGFELEIKRCIDLQTTDERPTKRVPLQWVDGKYFDQNAMLNNGESKIDNKTVCRFEASAFEVKAPEKTLNVVGNAVRSDIISSQPVFSGHMPFAFLFSRDYTSDIGFGDTDA
ncbi:unnamed protein product [Penicillium salamii]|nr:unnamed protein product [Penicillium salamii]CAG8102104.1 unnamed protein product [Penicillium salamii]CAG8393281.1 unnamed protein product [Penicillium salamii]